MRLMTGLGLLLFVLAAVPGGADDAPPKGIKCTEPPCGIADTPCRGLTGSALIQCMCRYCTSTKASVCKKFGADKCPKAAGNPALGLDPTANASSSKFDFPLGNQALGEDVPDGGIDKILKDSKDGKRDQVVNDGGNPKGVVAIDNTIGILDLQLKQKNKASSLNGPRPTPNPDGGTMETPK